MQGWYATLGDEVDLGLTPGKQDVQEIDIFLLLLRDVSVNRVVAVKMKAVGVISTLQELNQRLRRYHTLAQLGSH